MNTNTAPTRAPHPCAAAHPAAVAPAPHGARAGFPPRAITPRRSPSWRTLAPSALTALGLALGLAGATFLPSRAGALCLALSLLLDAADGTVARRLRAETAVGARFDLSTDVALAHVIAWATWPRAAAVVSAALVALVTLAPRLTPGGRVSGRVAVTAAALVWSWRVGGWALAPGAALAWGAALGALGLLLWLAGRRCEAVCP